MDSTSLCFLAARAGTPDLVTLRWAEADVANDDAAHAANGLRKAEHVVLPQAELPGIFADAGDSGDTEAPYRFTRTLARTRHSARVLAAYGGDELFHGPPAYLHSLLRQRPFTAITHLRGYRALHRWPLAATVSGMARRGDLGAWWHQQAHQLTTGPLPRRTPPLGWGLPLWAGVGWVTPAAAEATRTVLHATGDQARPLAADRGQHVTLSILRMMGPAYRQLARVFTPAGLRLALPYFDDRVVEAALAVRQHERRTPWRYKPLLAEAMRGILPETIARRCTKGESGEDLRVGLRWHLGDILDLFADSALATHGLINPDVLRRQLLTPQADHAVVFALEDLLGCETWLRAAQALASSPSRPKPPRRHRATATAL